MSRHFAGAFTLGSMTITALMTASSTAHADDSAHDKAAVAFQDGRKLIETGNCEAAIPKLRESLQFESSVGARLSIADCIETKDPLAAWKILKEAASLSLMNRDERLPVAEQRALALQSRLALITFRLPSAAIEQPGFELRVDGELVDRYVYRSGYATTQGKHLVEAYAPGRHFSGSVSVDYGVQASVDVALQNDDCRGGNARDSKASNASGSGAPTAPLVEVDRGASRRALGVAIGGIGVAGIASGIVFGILTLDKKRSIERECGGSTGSCTAPPGAIDPEKEAAKTDASISTVGFAVGAAALLAGAAIYITAPSTVAPTTGKGMRLAPTASRGGAGALLEGRF